MYIYMLNKRDLLRSHISKDPKDLAHKHKQYTKKETSNNNNKNIKTNKKINKQIRNVKKMNNEK